MNQDRAVPVVPRAESREIKVLLEIKSGGKI